jgi:hypothetical protein
MIITIVGAGVASRYGSGYGSGSDQKMQLLAAPAPQHWSQHCTELSSCCSPMDLRRRSHFTRPRRVGGRGAAWPLHSIILNYWHYSWGSLANIYSTVYIIHSTLTSYIYSISLLKINDALSIRVDKTTTASLPHSVTKEGCILNCVDRSYMYLYHGFYRLLPKPVFFSVRWGRNFSVLRYEPVLKIDPYQRKAWKSAKEIERWF